MCEWLNEWTRKQMNKQKSPWGTIVSIFVIKQDESTTLLCITSIHTLLLMWTFLYSIKKSSNVVYVRLAWWPLWQFVLRAAFPLFICSVFGCMVDALLTEGRINVFLVHRRLCRQQLCVVCKPSPTKTLFIILYQLFWQCVPCISDSVH